MREEHLVAEGDADDELREAPCRIERRGELRLRRGFRYTDDEGAEVQLRGDRRDLLRAVHGIVSDECIEMGAQRAEVGTDARRSEPTVAHLERGWLVGGEAALGKRTAQAQDCRLGGRMRRAGWRRWSRRVHGALPQDSGNRERSCER